LKYLNLNVDYYPIKILPIQIDRWINHKDFFPRVPSPGKSPQRQYVNYELALSSGCLINILVLVIFVAVMTLANKDYTLSISIVAGIVLVLLSIIYFNRIRIKRGNKRLKLNYNSEVKKYESKIRELKTLWNIDKRELGDKYSHYNKNDYLQSFVKYFSHSASNVIHSPSVGFSEAIFSEYLIKHFGNIVYSNLSLMYFSNDKLFPIYPDFLIYIPKYNFHLAIEIDEPYTDSENGEEIHYRDKNGGGFNKDFKNEEYYSNAFWFVIRFSEDQIIQSPDECCFEIYRFINGVYPEFKITNFDMKKATIDITHKVWTFEDCKSMKNNNHRSEIKNKLRRVNPFYNCLNNKFSFRGYEEYKNNFFAHEKDPVKLKEYSTILNMLKPVDFDLEIRNFEKHGPSSEKFHNDNDDLPF